MSIVDEAIRLDTRVRTVTIVRTPANATTYAVAEETGAGRLKLDPYLDFETFARFPSDSGIVSGDLLQISGSYFLAMAVETKFELGDVGFYKAVLYKCNSTVNIYSYNATTKKHDTVFKTGVKCLITQVRANSVSEDKAIVIKSYAGKSTPFQVFMRDSEGLTKDHIIVDQASRRFRIMKDFDLFISDGITQTQCLWETP